MMVGAVEPRLWDAGDEPVEERLVAGVHAQCDVRLASIAAEMSFADQEADQEAAFAWGEVDHPPSMTRAVSPSGFPWNQWAQVVLFHRQVSRGTTDIHGHPKICRYHTVSEAEGGRWSVAETDLNSIASARSEAPAPGRRPLPRFIAVANQKGGVGKTTTAVNVGAALAELGYRTLLVDLDPQGNASTGLGVEIRGIDTSMYHVIMHDVPLEDCVEATDVRNLFVAPASLDLAGAEIELVPAFSRETRLRRALEAVRDDYDYVLIDCPPSLGLLTVNGLAAAHEVMVPIQCEYYALEGLGQLLRNVDLVRRNLNPSLEISTIVCVMYDRRTKLADNVVAEVREHFGDKVCRTMVPRAVRISEAPSFGQPIITFDPLSRGAIAYRDIAKEVSGGPA